MLIMWSVVAILLVCFAYAAYARRNETLEEYTSNRGRTGALSIAFTVLGTCVGGWMFFGVVAIGYEAGVVGYMLGLVYFLGLLLLGLFAPAIKNAMVATQSDTLDDFLYKRFGRSVQVAVATVNICAFVAFLASQFIALGDFLKVFSGLDLGLAIWIGAVIVISYTAISGYKGVLRTDIIQFCVVLAASVFMVVFLFRDVSVVQVSRLPASLFTGLGYGSPFLIGAMVFLTPSFLVRSDLWQRIASARGAKSARLGFLISAPIMLVMYVIFTSIGIGARAVLGEGQQAALSGLEWFVRAAGSEAVMIPVAIAVFLAVLSTADSYLNIVAVGLVKVIRCKDWDEYERSGSVAISKRLIRWTSLMTVIVGILGIAMWRLLPSIVDLVLASASGLLVLAPALVLGFFSKRRPSGPAFWSIVVGAITIVTVMCVGGNPKTAFVPGVIVSVAVCVLGWVFTRKKKETAPDRA